MEEEELYRTLYPVPHVFLHPKIPLTYNESIFDKFQRMDKIINLGTKHKAIITRTPQPEVKLRKSVRASGSFDNLVSLRDTSVSEQNVSNNIRSKSITSGTMSMKKEQVAMALKNSIKKQHPRNSIHVSNSSSILHYSEKGANSGKRERKNSLGHSLRPSGLVIAYNNNNGITQSSIMNNTNNNNNPFIFSNNNNNNNGVEYQRRKSRSNTISSAPSTSTSTSTFITPTTSSIFPRRLDDDNNAKMCSTLTHPCMPKAVELFSSNPFTAIEYMITEKIVEENASDIAMMFYYGCFDASMLFSFLSVPNNPFADSIFDEFVNLMDFSYLDFDIAFRWYFYKLPIPLEANFDQVEKVVIKFSDHFFASQIGDKILRSYSETYVLAFGLIMLIQENNNNERNKMSLKKFIDTIRANRNGEEISDELLEDIYYKVLNDHHDPLKILSPSHYPKIIKRGWLFVYSKSGVVNNWKRKWVVLHADKTLSVYSKPDESSVPIFSSRVEQMTISPVGLEKGRTFCLKLHFPVHNDYYSKFDSTTMTSDCHILLSGSSAADINRWSLVLDAFN